MAIAHSVVIEGTRGGSEVRLTSSSQNEPAVVQLDISSSHDISPNWARYVAGVVAEMRPPVGFTGHVTSTVPAGAGLSSSAALEIAVALALGFDGPKVELAQLGRRAEHWASGVPCGIMDQLSSVCGQAGHALMIDCHALTVDPVTLPADVDIVVIHSGQERTLAGSGYADRVRQCHEVEAIIGPLRLASFDALDAIEDAALKRRARHVISENSRVRLFAAALADGELRIAGDIMNDSHVSLRDDYETSTPHVDALVAALQAQPGVYGVRITGGGFGGCVVAMTQPGALDDSWGSATWHVQPAQGARVETMQPLL